MATARIYMIYCVRHASSTDLEVVEVLTNLADQILASDYGVPLRDAVATLPAVVAAVATARDDPDNLFMTTGSGSVDDAFWPAPGQTTDVHAGQSREILLDFNDVGYSLNISLWDWDLESVIGDHDHLGSVTIYAEEAGYGAKAKLAKNDVEGSAYYVLYEVFA